MAIVLLIGTLIFAERRTTKQVQSILYLLQELKDKEYRYLELLVIIISFLIEPHVLSVPILDFVVTLTMTFISSHISVISF